MINEPPHSERAHWSWCRVCGTFIPLLDGEQEACRCDRHWFRNPCAIEGCKRSTAAPKDGTLALDLWLCGQHWRIACPPRSLRRRAYHAFFRRAKRYGWSPELNRQFWRFWFSLVASARRRCAAGHLDIAEIERMFG